MSQLHGKAKRNLDYLCLPLQLSRDLMVKPCLLKRYVTKGTVEYVPI